MAEDEMPQPRGIRRRVERSGGQPASDRCVAARLYTLDGKLVYAGRAGTGMPDAELERLWQRLRLLAVTEMPLSAPPPRGGRFGSPLALSRVHWVRPEMVVDPDCRTAWSGTRSLLPLYRLDGHRDVAVPGDEGDRELDDDHGN